MSPKSLPSSKISSTAQTTSLPPRSVRSPYSQSALERLIVLEGSVVATWGTVFLQVRRGPLSLESFESVTAAILRHRTLLPRGVLQGSMSLTEPGAPIAPEPVRIRQKAFVSEMLQHPNTRAVVVVFGENVDASLLRAASRGVVPSHPHLRVFLQPDEACKWMGEQIEVNGAQLLAAMTELRAIAERELRAPR